MLKNFSPHDLLPVAEPKTRSPNPKDFYKMVIRYLIPDIVKIMINGLPINLNKVKELEVHVDNVLAEANEQLQNNKIIQNFQIKQFEADIQKYIEDRISKRRDKSFYLKPFDASSIVHRSYFMHNFAKDWKITSPSSTLPSGKPRWTLNDLKLYKDLPVIQRLIAKELDETNNIYAKKAIEQIAEDKTNLYNTKFITDVSIIKKEALVQHPQFNPSSSQQKRKLFNSLGIHAENKSTLTGEDSFDREEILRIDREITNPEIKEITNALINHSFGSIIKNNFIPAFYDNTVKGRLFGSYRLFGTKTFRLTATNPNLLNLPSTGSIYAKPIKKCFIAPKGFVIYAVDLASLEDRVLANLSKDKNKINVFKQNLDGHCLNALSYFKDENTIKELSEIRQKGKPLTFGLSYGCGPNKVARMLKSTLSKGQSIFHNYHNVLYKEITEYREKYVLPTARKFKQIHLGMGCKLSSDTPNNDIRTLYNATCQFWSILSLLTANKIHLEIDKYGLQEDIFCISTIYDSLYYIVKKDG